MKCFAVVAMMTTVFGLLNCRPAGSQAPARAASEKGSAPQPGTAAPTKRAPITPSTNQPTTGTPPSRAPDSVWTPERVRAFVVETHQLFERTVNRIQASRDQTAKPIGDCFGGEPARPLIKTAEVLPSLEKRVQGKALRCYLATYFGCRIGDWLAEAGMAVQGPGCVPFFESKVTIVKQATDQVIADVVEAEVDDVLSNGHLNREKVNNGDYPTNSRYTLSRDDAGIWRISDRVPNTDDIECRER